MPCRTPSRLVISLFSLLALQGLAWASASSGLTYVMPPGGEGAAAVALGVALPGGLPSMEVNPALLAWEGDRTSSTIQYSSSSSALLPELHDDLHEDVSAVGLRFPIRPGTDVALGYSWHHLDLGQTSFQMTDISPVQTFNTEETVHHVVLSGRLGGIASVGIGWKWLDSRLAPGMVIDSAGHTMRGTASASTWDLGVLIAPKWRIPATPLRLGPSLGASWINVAEDSIDYGNSQYKDPVARVLRFGAAGELSAPDFFALQLFVDQETDLVDTANGSSSQYRGWSLDVLGFYRYSMADLDDYSGKRHERQVAKQYTFDFKQLWRLKWRLQHGEFTRLLGDAPEDYPLPSYHFLGAVLSPNFRFTWTRSTIYDPAGNYRNGQQRLGWALSL